MGVLLAFNQNTPHTFTAPQTFNPLASGNAPFALSVTNGYLPNVSGEAGLFKFNDYGKTPGRGSGTNSAINATIELNSGLLFANINASSIIANLIVDAGVLPGRGWSSVDVITVNGTDNANSLTGLNGVHVNSLAGPIPGTVTGLKIDDQTAGATNYAIKTGLGKVVLGDTLRLPVYAVASLPAGTQGDKALVNNALAPAFLAAPVGGGAVVCPVFHDGTSWKVG
jgi:hypothetical protein